MLWLADPKPATQNLASRECLASTCAMHPSTRFALGSFIALVLLSVVLVIVFEGGAL